jgi:dUTP pyrophosphatase
MPRLTSTAVIPTRATAHAAGYDLSASKACTVPAHGKAIVSTDLAIALPEHTYGRVAPRSGISWKWHLDIAAGVLDPDYRGAGKCFASVFHRRHRPTSARFFLIL